MEDGPGPGEQGAGDMRTSGWERGKAEDWLCRGEGEGGGEGGPT